MIKLHNKQRLIKKYNAATRDSCVMKKNLSILICQQLAALCVQVEVRAIHVVLWDIGKQNSPRCDAAERGVPSGAILFAWITAKTQIAGDSTILLFLSLPIAHDFHNLR